MGPLHAQPSTDPCADAAAREATVVAAFRALRAADPSADRALLGCAEHVRCGPGTDETLEACTTELTREAWGFYVRVVPRAADGAPVEMRVAVVDEGHAAQGAVVSGSRWAVSRGVAIVGITDEVLHTHGGAPARIGWARFRVRNDTGVALPVRALGGRFVTNERTTRLSVVSVSVRRIPPGTSEFDVGFTAQDAYQIWNDTFSVVVRLRVGDRTLSPSAAFQVTRVEAFEP